MAVALLNSDAIELSIFQTLGWGIYYSGFPVIIPASIAATVLNNLVENTLAPLSNVASLLGLPNLLPVVASTIEFDFDQEWTIADAPQEQGAFQSYDKVQFPFDLRVRLAVGGPVAARQAFLNSIFAIAGGSPLGSTNLITTALSAAGVGSLSGLGGLASSLTGGILSGALAPPLFDIITPEGSYASCSARRISFSRKADKGATLIAADIWWVQIRQTSTSSFGSTAVPGIAGQVSGGSVQPQTPSTSLPSGGLS